MIKCDRATGTWTAAWVGVDPDFAVPTLRHAEQPHDRASAPPRLSRRRSSPEQRADEIVPEPEAPAPPGVRSRSGRPPPAATWQASPVAPARLRGMRVHLGSDHAGFELKAHLIEWLQRPRLRGGRPRAGRVRPVDDYPPYVLRGRRRGRQRPRQPRHRDRRVRQRRGDRRQQGARRARRARVERRHGLARPRSTTTPTSWASAPGCTTLDEATRLVERFLTTPFSGDARHARRIAHDRRLREDRRPARAAAAPALRLAARLRTPPGTRPRGSARTLWPLCSTASPSPATRPAAASSTSDVLPRYAAPSSRTSSVRSAASSVRRQVAPSVPPVSRQRRRSTGSACR